MLPAVGTCLAGWTTDGHICGPGFFFDSVQTSEAELIYRQLLNFLVHL